MALPIYSCFFCEKVGPDLESCSHCQSDVHFCSEEHKKFHRFSVVKTEENHNEVESASYCFPYSVDTVFGKGRCVKANRDIQPGELILVDQAFVAGPLLNQNPVCLECHKEVPVSSNGNLSECPKCCFPLCESSDCRAGRWHSKLECKIFTQNKDLFKNAEARSRAYHSTGFVTALRLLLKTQDSTEQGTWQRVQQLMDHQDERRSDFVTWDSQNRLVVEPIQRLIELPKDFSSEDIQRAVGMLRTNGSRLESHKGSGKGLGLFPIYSMVNHSCLYNAVTKKAFITGDHYLKLESLKFIGKGEEIFSHYISSVKGTFLRQSQMQSKWYFSCQCLRCLDPTEFDSMSNALKCSITNNCQGFILPKDPTNLKSRWICTICSNPDDEMSECNSVSPNFVKEIYEKFEKEMKIIESGHNNDQVKCCQYSELLNLAVNQHFHKNNGCINEIREKLIILLKSETARLRLLAEREALPLRCEMLEKIAKLKLQQLSMVRQFTSVMSPLDPGQNFELVLERVGNELKETVAAARKLKFNAENGHSTKQVIV